MNHYEINVTRWKNGRQVHWFATHQRSIHDEKTAIEIAAALRCLPDAAEVTVTKWETTGTQTSL